MTDLPQCLLDSNITVALIDKNDALHAKAVLLANYLSKHRYQVFLSDILVNETLSVLAKRCEAKKNQALFKSLADTFFDYLRDKPLLCLYELVKDNFSQIKNLMVGHEGIFNFHDCLLLIFLKEIPRVGLATFDRDFEKIPYIHTINAQQTA